MLPQRHRDGKLRQYSGSGRVSEQIVDSEIFAGLSAYHLNRRALTRQYLTAATADYSAYADPRNYLPSRAYRAWKSGDCKRAATLYERIVEVQGTELDAGDSGAAKSAVDSLAALKVGHASIAMQFAKRSLRQYPEFKLGFFLVGLSDWCSGKPRRSLVIPHFLRGLEGPGPADPGRMLGDVGFSAFDAIAYLARRVEEKVRIAGLPDCFCWLPEYRGKTALAPLPR